MKICLLFATFVLSSVALFAHNHSLPLEPGRFLLGWNYYPYAANVLVDTYSPETGPVSLNSERIATSQFGSAWSGDSLSFEMGVLPRFSMGAKAQVFRTLGTAIVQQTWDFEGSLFTSVDLSPGGPWRLMWDEEFQPSPWFSQKLGDGNGLINLFSTLSLAYTVLETDEVVLSPYLDTKVVASFPHPWYDTYAGDRASNSVLNSRGTTADFVVVRQPTAKLATALGADLELYHVAILYLGWNIPWAQFGANSTPGQPAFSWIPILQQSPATLFDLSTFEFELKFRL
jgi:hypothetical protein